MERERYPADWERIALEVKEKAGWRCGKCGKQCRKPGDPFDTHKNTLTVAHLNHTPEDVRPENLMAMCAPCHLKYDAQHHAETRRRKKDGRSERLCIADQYDHHSNQVQGRGTARANSDESGA